MPPYTSCTERGQTKAPRLGFETVLLSFLSMAKIRDSEKDSKVMSGCLMTCSNREDLD